MLLKCIDLKNNAIKNLFQCVFLQCSITKIQWLENCVPQNQKIINFASSFFPAYCHSKEALPNLCSLITGDALLYSMFRVEASPVQCPFRGPFTFSYNRGHGECKSPPSSVDSCTEDSRLLLRYQACPDVSGTESTGEYFLPNRNFSLLIAHVTQIYF
jgi:hypothetical protein